jgi:hypothetical protein
MIRLELKIESGDAAITDDPRGEVTRLLRKAAQDMEAGRSYGGLMDINGNKVGSWELQDVDTDSKIRKEV